MSNANAFDSFPWPTEFHRLASRVLITNELGGRDPHKIYNVGLRFPDKTHFAKFPNSGYSFGFIQWDLANNATGLQIFTSILDKAVANNLISNDVRRVILDKVVLTNGDLLAHPEGDLTKEEKKLIDRALGSADGQEAIKTGTIGAVSDAVAFADAASQPHRFPQIRASGETTLRPLRAGCFWRTSVISSTLSIKMR